MLKTKSHVLGNTTTTMQDEQRYLNLVQHVLDHGVKRTDRTGVGTRSVFAPDPLRFDLTNQTMPLLTTKRTYWKGIVEELLWFLRGDTNATHLAERGVRIWDANAARAFLDDRGLQHLKEGDIGAGYGFQWRHFGASYKGCDQDYTGQGTDQIQYVLDQIRQNPTSRRIFLSAWNAHALSQMALPPCHVSVQFYVHAESKELSCHMYQRSVDLGLGEPFNIASYALLTHLIAHVCGLTAKSLTISMGDTHIYLNHVDALKKQLQRTPRPFPTLQLNANKKRLEEFTAKDIILNDYKPHPRIAMSMAV